MTTGKIDTNVFERHIGHPLPTIMRGEGPYLWDNNGKKYLDAVGGTCVVNIGHGVPEIREAMMKQAEKVCFTYSGAFMNEPLEELCERLCRITPEGLNHAFVVSGGSEATEAAIKMARQYHLETGSPGKFKLIGRWQGFHGNTIAALSVTGRTSWRNYFAPYLLNFPHIHPPHCYRCPYGKEYPGCDLACAWELERTISQEGEDRRGRLHSRAHKRHLDNRRGSATGVLAHHPRHLRPPQRAAHHR